MTTVFVWNNCHISTAWNKMVGTVGLKGPAKWSHAVSGHAAVMISDEWEKPFKQIVQTKAILDEYDTLRVAWVKATKNSPEEIAARLKMEKQGALLEPCLTDKTELYTSFFPDEYERSSHETNPMVKKFNAKFNTKFSVNYFRKGLTHRSFWHDLLWEGYVPDHIIYLPETMAQKTKMKKSWLDHRTKKDGDLSYRFKYKNCSRMASRVIISGFGDLLNLYWSGKVAARKIWTPLHVKRLSFKLAEKITGAKALTWNEFVDDMVKKNVVPQASSEKLKKYKRRASVRGSSGADARFNYSTKGTMDDKKNQNTADFLEPVLGKKPAQNVGHIFGLGTDFTESALEIAIRMGLAQADNSVPDDLLLGNDLFGEDFDPGAELPSDFFS